MTIPGVGAVTATAIVASARAADDCKSGRHFSAWLGVRSVSLTDRIPARTAAAASTGGVDRLGGISKRGNGYLRRLLVHGSRSIMRWRGKSWTWLARLRGRRPANVATVAVANKTARVIRAMLKHGGVYGTPMRNASWRCNDFLRRQRPLTLRRRGCEGILDVMA
ncbi:transposase [Mangrovicoccus ximenensis]|uniref:transposase n=1 Tax=Mangrovicoccus ximenensis TaxID=1911570 RepID=UPI001F0216FF|nr:transposase [Mangrovicoccus ximenensis]